MHDTGLRARWRAMLKETLGRPHLYEREFFSVYPYMFDPVQLRWLMDCLTRTASISGSIVEVGCAYGASTVMLKKWMKCNGISKRYVAIDTFSGFPEEQAEHEIVNRNKPSRIRWAFRHNKRSWVARSLHLAGIDDVELIQADAATFDYSLLKPISFCLLDVDLYIPVAAALPRIYDNLQPGGLIVLDDCMEDERWDGALQAYTEFVESRGLPKEIVCGKLGLISKN